VLMTSSGTEVRFLLPSSSSSSASSSLPVDLILASSSSTQASRMKPTTTTTTHPRLVSPSSLAEKLVAGGVTSVCLYTTSLPASSAGLFAFVHTDEKGNLYQSSYRTLAATSSQISVRDGDGGDDDGGLASSSGANGEGPNPNPNPNPSPSPDPSCPSFTVQTSVVEANQRSNNALYSVKAVMTSPASSVPSSLACLYSIDSTSYVLPMNKESVSSLVGRDGSLQAQSLWSTSNFKLLPSQGMIFSFVFPSTEGRNCSTARYWFTQGITPQLYRGQTIALKDSERLFNLPSLLFGSSDLPPAQQFKQIVGNCADMTCYESCLTKGQLPLVALCAFDSQTGCGCQALDTAVSGLSQLLRMGKLLNLMNTVSAAESVMTAQITNPDNSTTPIINGTLPDNTTSTDNTTSGSDPDSGSGTPLLPLPLEPDASWTGLDANFTDPIPSNGTNTNDTTKRPPLPTGLPALGDLLGNLNLGGSSSAFPSVACVSCLESSCVPGNTSTEACSKACQTKCLTGITSRQLPVFFAELSKAALGNPSSTTSSTMLSLLSNQFSNVVARQYFGSTASGAGSLFSFLGSQSVAAQGVSVLQEETEQKDNCTVESVNECVGSCSPANLSETIGRLTNQINATVSPIDTLTCVDNCVLPCIVSPSVINSDDYRLQRLVRSWELLEQWSSPSPSPSPSAEGEQEKEKEKEEAEVEGQSSRIQEPNTNIITITQTDTTNNNTNNNSPTETPSELSELFSDNMVNYGLALQDGFQRDFRRVMTRLCSLCWHRCLEEVESCKECETSCLDFGSEQQQTQAQALSGSTKVKPVQLFTNAISSGLLQTKLPPPPGSNPDRNLGKGFDGTVGSGSNGSIITDSPVSVQSLSSNLPQIPLSIAQSILDRPGLLSVFQADKVNVDLLRSLLPYATYGLSSTLAPAVASAVSLSSALPSSVLASSSVPASSSSPVSASSSSASVSATTTSPSSASSSSFDAAMLVAGHHSRLQSHLKGLALSMFKDGANMTDGVPELGLAFVPEVGKNTGSTVPIHCRVCASNCVTTTVNTQLVECMKECVECAQSAVTGQSFIPIPPPPGHIEALAAKKAAEKDSSTLHPTASSSSTSTQKRPSILRSSRQRRSLSARPAPRLNSRSNSINIQSKSKSSKGHHTYKSKSTSKSHKQARTKGKSRGVSVLSSKQAARSTYHSQSQRKKRLSLAQQLARKQAMPLE